MIYTNIATRYDELVTPHTNSFMLGRNVTNITVQDHCAFDFSDHLSIISSPITGQYILDALGPRARGTGAVCACVPGLRQRSLAPAGSRPRTVHRDRFVAPTTHR